MPLSSAALTALKHQAKIRSSDAVFPGLTAWSLSYNTFATAPTRAGFDAGAPHGWRSVFRGWANNVQRVDRELAEFALAHVQGATEGAYNRETAIEPRRPVMGAYAHWLETDGANVIPFQARA